MDGTGSKLQIADEKGTVEKAQQGDRRAFEELVRAHSDKLYASVLRLVGDRKDAEEATQEAFLRAWRSIGKFKGQSSFFTWLYRIGINEAKRRIERRPTAEMLSLDAEREETGSVSKRPDHRDADPTMSRQLLESISSLSFEYRAPLVLRDIEGLSAREGAETMEISEAAFKSRLHRARLKMRKELKDYLVSEEGGAP